VGGAADETGAPGAAHPAPPPRGLPAHDFEALLACPREAPAPQALHQV
jgi:hypothetical protein